MEEQRLEVRVMSRFTAVTLLPLVEYMAHYRPLMYMKSGDNLGASPNSGGTSSLCSPMPS